MSFPFQALEATGGSLYAHVYENPATGVALDLYHSLTIEFAARADTDELASSLTIEWLRFSARDWRTIGGPSAPVALDDELVEASFYLTEHNPASVSELALHRVEANRFRARVVASVGSSGPITADVEVDFEGLIVVPDNLFPKPNTPALVSQLVERFADPSGYHPPELDRFRYVLLPITEI